MVEKKKDLKIFFLKVRLLTFYLSLVEPDQVDCRDGNQGDVDDVHGGLLSLWNWETLEFIRL